MILDLNRGFWVAAHWRGAPIRFHWTTPLIALLIGVSSGGLSLFTLLASVMAVSLLLLHELGHAFFVRRYGHEVVSVDVFGFHGLCRWRGHASAYENAMISWGGVVFQAGLLLLTLIPVLILGRESLVTWTAYEVFVRSNLFIIFLNLLPIPPLDGATAWTLVPILRDRAARRRPRPRPATRPQPNLRLVKPMHDDFGDEDPPSEESRRIADAAIREALEASRAKDRNGNSKPTLH